MLNQSQQLAALTAPFSPELIQFRAGATTKKPDKDNKFKAMALAYVEPRDYEDRLNAVFGLEWSCHFKEWGANKIICELTIQGHTRSSTGEANEGEGFAVGTAAEAQAFKRACSKFGLGRELYNYPKVWVEYDKVKKQLIWGKTKKPYLAQQVQQQPTQQTITVEQVQPQVQALKDDVLISQNDAAALHKYLGSTYGNWVKSSEHKYLASLAMGREITSFTELTRSESKLVMEEVRETAAERKRASKKLDEVNPVIPEEVDSSDEAAKAVVNY